MLWVFFFSGGKQNILLFWNSSIRRGSVYWNFLCRVDKNIQHSLNFRIIDNSALSFIWDPWCFGISVAERVRSEQPQYSLLNLSNLP